MIMRVWHGWTTTGNADAYPQLLTTSIVPGIMSKPISGLDGVDILRRAHRPDTEVEFVTVMSFVDWSAVEEFASPDRAVSVVPVATRQVLKRYSTPGITKTRRGSPRDAGAIGAKSWSRLAGCLGNPLDVRDRLVHPFPGALAHEQRPENCVHRSEVPTRLHAQRQRKSSPIIGWGEFD